MRAPFAFVQQGGGRRKTPNLHANIDYSGDHYLEHLESLLKQCKYRSKVYKLSAGWAEEKDEMKYQTPLETISTISTLFSVIVVFSQDATKRNILALLAGMLSIVGASWTSMKNAEKLGIKATNYRTAAKRYSDLSLDVFKVITKVRNTKLGSNKFSFWLTDLIACIFSLIVVYFSQRKSQYQNGKKPVLTNELRLQRIATLGALYTNLKETEDAIKFLPPADMVMYML